MFKIYRYVDDDSDKISSHNDLDHQDDVGLGDYSNNIVGDEKEPEPEKEAWDDEDDIGIEDEEENDEDSDFQGIIRTVPGACLVYKRKDQQNRYEELWVYNAGGRDIKPEMRIRNSILAGTDIDPKTQKSPDGEQRCDTLSVGNVQFLHIFGLIN